MNKHDDFFDREREQQELKSILTSKPSLIYFVYGPINSGKTSLLVRVLGALPADTVPFYINLRGRNVSSAGDFLDVLFKVDRKSTLDNARDYLKQITNEGVEVLRKLTGVPVPTGLFNLLFKEKEKGEDAFEYLEEFWGEMVSNGLKPVFVLDELQVIKEIANTAGRPLLEKLFNFMVRMTKETHLCHCLAATSDSLFIKEIYGNARLQGRSRYYLVDDLDMERAVQVYDDFGFENKELVWDYIGGKIGDMTRLTVELRLGLTEKQALERMRDEEVSRLRWVLGELKTDEPDNYEARKMFLAHFARHEVADFDPEAMKDGLTFWASENVLFLEAVRGVVRPQGQLTKQAIMRDVALRPISSIP